MTQIILDPSTSSHIAQDIGHGAIGGLHNSMFVKILLRKKNDPETRAKMRKAGEQNTFMISEMELLRT